MEKYSLDLKQDLKHSLSYVKKLRGENALEILPSTDRILKDVSAKFHCTLEEILSFPHRYKTHYIKKRHRGLRKIEQPSKQVKEIQKWVIKRYFSHFNTHRSAIAYCKNKNILHFSMPHKNNKFLLKLDFKDFFTHIKSKDFYRFCLLNNEYLNFSINDLIILEKILFHKGYLSIGSPSSPMLSNLIMTQFDELMYQYCTGHNVIYTRYADDLAFSSNTPNVLCKVVQYVEDFKLDYPIKLTINHDKTVFTSRKFNRTLTGLVLSNDGKVSIGREKKRRLRAMAHQAKLGLLSDKKIEQLRGHIAFLKSVDLKFALRLEQNIPHNNYINSSTYEDIPF